MMSWEGQCYCVIITYKQQERGKATGEQRCLQANAVVHLWKRKKQTYISQGIISSEIKKISGLVQDWGNLF